MEVCCGQCGGRLLVETPGVVVSCPHCGVHLLAPVSENNESSLASSLSGSEIQALESSPAAESIPLPSNSMESPPSAARSPSSGAETIFVSDIPRVPPMVESRIDAMSFSIHDSDDEDLDLSDLVDFNRRTSIGLPQADSIDMINSEPVDDQTGAKPNPVAIPAVPDFSWMESAKPLDHEESVAPWMMNLPAEGHAAGSSPSDGPVNFRWSADVLGGSDRVKLPPQSEQTRIVPSGAASLGTDFPNRSQPRPQESTPLSTGALPTAERESRQSWQTMLLIVVGTYASLVTIYLVYTMFFVRPHQLESLPDLKTVQQQGGRAVVPRPENDLPKGHQLRIGQSERYGNLRVTPLRVTRGLIAFMHHTGDPTRVRSSTEPVLKLWLRFENVSEHQTIIPLDTTLMSFRRILEDRVASYNVIFREIDRKHRRATFYYPFDRLAGDSEWTIAGQHTNESLGPHEVYETFVPSEENVEELAGDVIWRVHFRKGYGPQTGNGVTTLIDVQFHSDDIRPDSV